MYNLAASIRLIHRNRTRSEQKKLTLFVAMNLEQVTDTFSASLPERGADK